MMFAMQRSRSIGGKHFPFLVATFFLFPLPVEGFLNLGGGGQKGKCKCLKENTCFYKSFKGNHLGALCHISQYTYNNDFCDEVYTFGSFVVSLDACRNEGICSYSPAECMDMQGEDPPCKCAKTTKNSDYPDYDFFPVNDDGKEEGCVYCRPQCYSGMDNPESVCQNGSPDGCFCEPGWEKKSASNSDNFAQQECFMCIRPAGEKCKNDEHCISGSCKGGFCCNDENGDDDACTACSKKGGQCKVCDSSTHVLADKGSSNNGGRVCVQTTSTTSTSTATTTTTTSTSTSTSTHPDKALAVNNFVKLAGNVQFGVVISLTTGAAIVRKCDGTTTNPILFKDLEKAAGKSKVGFEFKEGDHVVADYDGALYKGLIGRIESTSADSEASTSSNGAVQMLLDIDYGKEGSWDGKANSIPSQCMEKFQTTTTATTTTTTTTTTDKNSAVVERTFVAVGGDGEHASKYGIVLTFSGASAMILTCGDDTTGYIPLKDMTKKRAPLPFGSSQRLPVGNHVKFNYGPYTDQTGVVKKVNPTGVQIELAQSKRFLDNIPDQCVSTFTTTTTTRTSVTVTTTSVTTKTATTKTSTTITTTMKQGSKADGAPASNAAPEPGGSNPLSTPEPKDDGGSDSKNGGATAGGDVDGGQGAAAAATGGANGDESNNNDDDDDDDDGIPGNATPKKTSGGLAVGMVFLFLILGVGAFAWLRHERRKEEKIVEARIAEIGMQQTKGSVGGRGGVGRQRPAAAQMTNPMYEGGAGDLDSGMYAYAPVVSAAGPLYDATQPGVGAADALYEVQDGMNAPSSDQLYALQDGAGTESAATPAPVRVSALGGKEGGAHAAGSSAEKKKKKKKKKKKQEPAVVVTEEGLYEVRAGMSADTGLYSTTEAQGGGGLYEVRAGMSADTGLYSTTEAQGGGGLYEVRAGMSADTGLYSTTDGNGDGGGDAVQDVVRRESTQVGAATTSTAKAEEVYAGFMDC